MWSKPGGQGRRCGEGLSHGVPSHLLLLLAGVGLVWALLPEHEPGASYASIGLGVLGPCAGREGCGSVSTGWNLRALAGNPMNAFLIFSFSFIFIIYLTQPPPPSFNPFMFSESASLCRLYTNLCVPSDAFLLGEVKYL